ncbi:MAG: adenylosuccinate lyase [Gammaproteobacteria bacterium CG_4_10_14_0_8_um_filter_38_16]|nr:MAG: adenylosuccinate lyase [Gammaproteobacteria bacterium CG_4_10_14_0_8_um_filter_38_16]PJA04360.1 MAG: adenylosuccinate lyase [Gammaproteobacteria bacterium CG_4_10_14_0_2_um_filter_38_22]PJB09549.1 MAG: adenylosuccinate lyase [Gammaproteobacteria bacterium CG_4_9_14_3_um_filter_38_9]
MQLSPITALSPLDGRYSKKTEELRPIVSEYALIFYRLQIEIAWLETLAKNKDISEIAPLTKSEQAFLKKILGDFNEKEATKIKKIEHQTNHDVKAVEYYLREKCEMHKTLKRLSPWIHFACTSEDINNLAYALMIKKTRDTILKPELENIISQLNTFAHDTATFSMLSRTHGQAATPTTLGKEFKNFAVRLNTHYKQWMKIPITGKFNGAVGNFNAHVVAYPKVNWLRLSKQFVTSLGLEWNAYTTQIEPHDYLAQWLNAWNICNTILIDLSRDIWGYISLRYFTQKKLRNEVGSSTMPHKVNPIDFENAEGNLGICIALATHLSQKLPISRWQRDLTDSTVLRNLGSIAGYAIVAYHALLKGLSKLIPNHVLLKKELDTHWEVLAEPIQMVMRKYGISDAYEQLKYFSRGEAITQKQISQFIDDLSIPASAKKQLQSLSPDNYIGLAIVLAKKSL